MKRLFQTSCLMGALRIFAMGGAAVAHEGHDHTLPSGLWPKHAKTEEPAVPAAFAVVESDAEAPVLEESVAELDLRITTWKLSDGSTGYSTQDGQTDAIVTNILADVNTVAYDDEYVYVRTSGIPSHDIGTSTDPNPAKPGDVDATYRIRLDPVEETGDKTATGLSSIGIMVNGVSFYNQSDGFAWNSENNLLDAQVGGAPPGGGAPPVGGMMPPRDDTPGEGPSTETTPWAVNALWSRQDGLDEAGGHSSPNFGSTNPDGSLQGLYHYHQMPFGLDQQIDPENDGDMGSPVYGYAFDGYAVVGPYAYVEEDGVLSVMQMTSSYRLEDNRGEDGPTVEDYELGSFINDFVYQEGTGTLNRYNMAFVKFDGAGRAIVTDPSDRDGEWAYFLTLDVINAISGNDTTLDGGVAFPYIVGPEYFGVVDGVQLAPGAVITVPNDVAFHFRYVTVPEPASVVQLAVGTCVLTCRWRRGGSASSPSRAF